MANNTTRKSLVLGIIISLLLFNLISVDWVKADEVTVTFSGITNPSSTHIAYEYSSDSATAWGGTTTEASTDDYTNLVGINGVYFSTTTATTTADYTYHTFWINIGNVGLANGFTPSDISSLEIKWDGYAIITGPSYGVFMALYNHNTSSWQSSNSGYVNGTWTHTDSTVNSLIVTVPEANVSEYIYDGIDYFVKVSVRSAQCSSGNSNLYSDRFYVKITYTPTLTAPTLVSPTNGGTGYTITPNFDWNVSTGGTSPYTYELMVDADIAFGSPDINATGISDSNYSYTTGLTPATVYYWKVRTKDNGGAYSSWATTQSFTTASFASPSFVVPTAGATVTTVTPTFSWSASTGGDGNYTYELQVSLNSGFTGTAVDVTGITTTSYTMTSNLTPDTYYAKIRAKDGLGNYTAWSSTVSFTATTPSTEGGVGGSSSSATSEQAPYIPPVLTTNNDTPATTSSSSGTSVFTKYIVNPVKVIIINPLVALWDWFVGLFRGSSQESINDVLERPIGIGKINVPLGWILLAGLALFVLFGDGIKMPKFKVGKKIRKGGKRLW